MDVLARATELLLRENAELVSLTLCAHPRVKVGVLVYPMLTVYASLPRGPQGEGKQGYRSSSQGSPAPSRQHHL